MPAGELMLHQHDEARHVVFLLSGSVQFLIRFEGVDDLYVGGLGEPGALIGWSSFRIPYRFTASVRCEEDCRVLRIPREIFEALSTEEPQVDYLLLKRVAASLALRLEQTRDLLLGRTVGPVST